MEESLIPPRKPARKTLDGADVVSAWWERDVRHAHRRSESVGAEAETEIERLNAIIAAFQHSLTLERFSTIPGHSRTM